MTGLIHRALNRALGRAEEINGHGRCPTYLYRWVLLKTRWGNAYVHKFVGSDWARDLHDHPKRFISVGLWGTYTEENVHGFRTYRAPWIRTFPANHRHRLSVVPGSQCWTLLWVGKAVRMWGFWQDGKFIPWREYVEGLGGDRGQACE